MLFFQRKCNTSLSAEIATDLHSRDGEQVAGSSGLCDIHPMLRQLQSRLLQLAGSTEHEFLTIGSRLLDFHARTAEIGNNSVMVTDQMGGNAIREAIRELSEIVERMAEFLAHVENEAEKSSKTLTQTLQMIAGVDDPLAGFKKIIKVLHVLGTATKIESARLGPLGAGFNSLADDVENLAVQINEKSASILAKNAALSTKIRETLARMSDIEIAQRENVHLVLDKSCSSLELITEGHRKCAEVAAEIAASTGEVSRNISEIVTSMQFHDITRQQLEHVQEALDELEHRLEASYTRGDNGQIEKEMAAEVYSVCRLQAAQLSQAQEGLTAAVAGIVENLTGLADQGREMAHRTRDLIDAADDAGGSLFSDIEMSLTPVAVLLAKSAAANRTLSQAVASVAETVGEIASFVNDIETVGEEIKLIALNSQVKAARTGDEGAALGVLAESIQRLSLDACAQTAAVTDTLREITRATGQLSEMTAAETHSGELDTETLSSSLKELIASIHGINGGVIATLTKIDNSAHLLSNDIDDATVGITVHGTVAREVISITSELEQIMARICEMVPDIDLVDLEALSERYTMHSERLVHAAILGGTGGQDSLPDSGSGAGGSGEDTDGLGDNVELF